MDTKIIIGAVIAVIAIIGIGAFALGGGHTQHASNELVTCVAIHSGEPEFGFDPCTVGDIMNPEQNPSYKVHFLKEMQTIIL